MELYRQTSFDVSRIITKNFSSSFYLSTLLLDKSVKTAIHSVYGFVRYADEIVDTLHDFDKLWLLNKFEADMNEAIEKGISTNPVLDAFQFSVNKYNIPHAYIDSFLKSMKMDIDKKTYLTKDETEEYVYGSANVVGLICLKIFCHEQPKLFEELVKPAEMLGSAFQKVNFLRDLKADTEILNRSYFWNINQYAFDEKTKKQLIDEIEAEFDLALAGLRRLPGRSKLAVLTAYNYYRSLLRKIKRTQASLIMKKRIRISNAKKLGIMAKAAVEWKLNII